MHLILFDIDGTLIDSIKADDACFIQTFSELYKIDLAGVDWNSFPHVTDSGLTHEIFQRFFQRAPREEEVQRIKAHFYQLLEQRASEFVEIEGALTFIQKIDTDPQYSLAFATGGWKETALLKTRSIGLDLSKYVLVSASDHYDRAVITQLAIEAASAQNVGKDFTSITYIGDGLWDLATSNRLNIRFVGIDYHSNNRLTDAGADWVIKDFGQWDHIPTF